ncbi:hypothetical protein HA402_014816 [Bradysia odoriphaga]|nr:hypothetical protein HA402_014816 [Bradysia odoriphaga]
MKYLAVVFFSCFVNCAELIPNFNGHEYFESGVSRRVRRLVDGKPAVLGQFPGQISLQKAAGYPSDKSHFCGGYLIHERHVLTTAECVTTKNGSPFDPSFFVLVGDDLTTFPVSSTRQARNASNVFIHPGFHSNVRYGAQDLQIETINHYDIAVMRTSEPFIRTDTFFPVAKIDVIPNAGEECGIAGWGSTREGGPYSQELLQITISIIDKKKCNEYYNGQIGDGMFCAGFLSAERDICDGDIGGGLICKNLVAGTAAWAKECETPNKPGIYIDIPWFNTWIEEKINQNTDVTEAPGSIGSIGSTMNVLSFNLSVVCIFLLLTLSHHQ